MPSALPAGHLSKLQAAEAVVPARHAPEQSMEMHLDSLKEVLGELFALLETQETNSTAVPPAPERPGNRVGRKVVNLLGPGRKSQQR